ADVQASRQAIALRHLTLSRNQIEIAGDVVIGAIAQRDLMDATVAVQVSVKNLPIAATAREFGINVDADALANAVVHVSGTARRPEAEVSLDETQVAVAGEK